jgi:hypothetical protein
MVPCLLLQVLRSAIRLLIRLRRHESVRLDRAVAGLKTSHMPWLHTRAAAAAATRQTPAAAATAAAAAGGGSVAGDAGLQEPLQQQQQQGQQQQQQRHHVSPGLHAAKLAWLRCWAWWLLGQFVVPLLRNSFYITESEPYRQEVFYYRCAIVEKSECCFAEWHVVLGMVLFSRFDFRFSGCWVGWWCRCCASSFISWRARLENKKCSIRFYERQSAERPVCACKGVVLDVDATSFAAAGRGGCWASLWCRCCATASM